MKKFYLFLLLSLMALSSFSQLIIGGGDVSRDEAVREAQNMFAGKDVDIYLGESTSQWIVFIDEQPLMGWEHPCTYLYVGKTKNFGGGLVYSKVSAMRPSGKINLTPISVKNRTPRAPLNIKVPRNNSNMVNSKTYAVILSGGINKYSNYERYWNDCSFIYQTLINKYCIPKQNTYVVMADGTDPAEDMNCFGYFKSSSLDLDFDGFPDLKYAATKANITSIFNELSQKLTENDQLFFYVIDHGGSNDEISQSYICLWNNESLEDYELSAMLDKIKAGSMNIVLGQCFSGGFIDNIQKKGRVISTASTGAESSWSCGDIPYDEFVYHWTSAVAGQTAYGVSVYPDTDNSGHTTMDEAFKFAKQKDRRNETPMYSSQPLSIGEDLAFDKAPQLIDLYIKDNTEDTGKEPNLTTDISWNSPDVWIRNQKDGIEEHENPYYSDMHTGAHIYVKITNRGTKNYLGEGKYLHLYYAKASTGLTLKAWRGKELYNGNVTGYHLRPIQIDFITAGTSRTFVVNWELPNDLLGPESDNDTENHHFCLLARVSDNFTDTDDDLCMRYNSVDALKGNNIAQKNLSIINKSNSPNMTSTVFVRNTMDVSRKYTLEVRPHTTADRNLFTDTQMNLVMSQPILNAWNSGGSQSIGIAYSPSVNPKSFQLQSADSKIKGISLNKNEFEKVSLQCILKNFVLYTRSYAFDLIQRDELTGEIIGGESFIIDPRNSFVWQQPIIISSSKTDSGKYNLSVDNTKEVFDFTWIDQAGNVLGTTSEVTVSPIRGNNQYTVTAVSKEEGILSEASITLDQAQGIKSATPNSAIDYVDIVLKEPANNDLTSVRIQAATDNQMIIQKNIMKGHSQIRMELDQMPKGVLIIQLVDNNQIVDNSKILKN